MVAVEPVFLDSAPLSAIKGCSEGSGFTTVAGLLSTPQAVVGFSFAFVPFLLPTALAAEGASIEEAGAGIPFDRSRKAIDLGGATGWITGALVSIVAKMSNVRCTQASGGMSAPKDVLPPRRFFVDFSSCGLH